MIRTAPTSSGKKPRKPRASGDDPFRSVVTTHHGFVNPARAGMIRTDALAIVVGLGKPRASGDDPRGILKSGNHDT
mgnify:CR=1 FL=1